MMRRGALLCGALCAALAALAGALPARADDVAEAKARVRRGAELYRAQRWRDAIAEFEAAYRLKPHGAIHFNVAQCREQLGEWPAALRGYHDYLREVSDAPDRAAVRAKIRRIEGRLAGAGVQALLVYSDPPGAEVRLDGRVRGATPFHTALPPGTYAVSIALDGHEEISEEVTLAPGASRAVDVVLRPASKTRPLPPVLASAPAVAAAAAARDATPASAAAPLAVPPPQPADLAARAPAGAGVPAELPVPAPAPAKERRRLYTWIAAGAAVAAGAAGAYFGWSAARDEDALASMTAPDGARADRLARDAESKARKANVLYAVGGGAAAAGITLFFVEKRF